MKDDKQTLIRQNITTSITEMKIWDKCIISMEYFWTLWANNDSVFNSKVSWSYLPSVIVQKLSIVRFLLQLVSWIFKFVAETSLSIGRKNVNICNS